GRGRTAAYTAPRRALRIHVRLPAQCAVRHDARNIFFRGPNGRENGSPHPGLCARQPLRQARGELGLRWFSNTWTHSLLRTGEAVRVTVVACRVGRRRGGGVRLEWVVSAKKEALPPPRCRIVRTGVRTWPVSRLGLAISASWCPSGSFRQMLQARGPLRPGGFPYGVFVPAFQASNLSADCLKNRSLAAREP